MTDIETNRYRDEETEPRRSPLAMIGFVIAVVAAVVVILAGPLSRVGLWEFRTGFQILKWGSYLALLGAGLGLLGGIGAIGKRRGVGFALLALAIGLCTAYFPWSFSRKASRVPPIHDITTDTTNPPSFVAILPLRAEAPNPAEYGGDSIAQQQRVAYPDVQPLVVDAPADRAFAIALEAARERDWEIVAADAAQGRIEATATTFWFGFKDDVVVRVRPIDTRSLVDVRSVSRVGRGDVGKNAERIQAYLEKVREMS